MDLQVANGLIADLERALKAAESASKAKSVFLANMSHEIRTPLNSIIGFAELAQDDNISAGTHEYLRKITESASSMRQIIDDILDISYVESGKMVLDHIPFDLHQVFVNCQSDIMPKALDKGIALYCYAERSVGKKMLGDPARLRQVLIHLLSNAIKFTDSGVVKLLASLIGASESRATIRFEVKDSGIGMTAEEIEQIFEPFTQVDDSTTRPYGGTGLGLAIAKNIVEMMDGKLTVDSKPGEGSQFSFELTFDTIEPESVPPPVPTPSADTHKPTFSGEVLVCEDNALNQQMILDHLEKVGLAAVLAENGKIGVEIVTKRLREKKKPFDLILMDIHMPVMDGLEAASRIFALGSETPIVAITANVMANDQSMYRTSGMSGVLAKPFTAQELWKCLMGYFEVVSTTKLNKSRLAEETEKEQKRLSLDFAKGNQTTYEDMQNAIATGDIRTAHRMAHSLKGNAALIGAKKLQELAAAAERALANGENHLTDAKCQALESELKAVLGKLAPLVAADAQARRKAEPPGKKNVFELFDRLEPMLANKNPGSIELLDEIFAIPEAKTLALLIDDFEFKKAHAELLELKERMGMAK